MLVPPEARLLPHRRALGWQALLAMLPERLPLAYGSPQGVCAGLTRLVIYSAGIAFTVSQAPSRCGQE